MDQPILINKDPDVWETKDFLVYCAETRPNVGVEDYVIILYQSEFGDPSQLRDPEAAWSALQKDLSCLTDQQKNRAFFQPVCGNFCRMNLSVSSQLSPELMNHITLISAKEVPKGARARLEEKLRLFRELVKEQPELFQFSVDEVDRYLEEYKKRNFPVIRHSLAYQEAYAPAYRVVRKEFSHYTGLLAAIDKALKGPGQVNVALDGYCCAGKTQAANLISTLFDCNVFHTEDFFLPLEKRTAHRMAEIGGTLDWERFKSDVCEKVREGKPFSYQTFNCDTMALDKVIEVTPKKLNIFEGPYSMHPELREYYDISAFFTIPHHLQKARILNRKGSLELRAFLEEWIPKENAYFDNMNVQAACNFWY